ncbi:rhodanese-like domain-containing protein [Desulfonema ishimotonii]|uniref:Rhodanese-like domain-containing protein n=1 Tax=Desulfonema ishimotonii TaxID=45657 RepID=A0A401FX94_9BACT|nr:rhodanese-like domain-containing protein [Desulfonema ishimotonii]GBC61585.1 rhodanese-like domain-containing protein [Desulfonema ishimotonii]
MVVFIILSCGFIFGWDLFWFFMGVRPLFPWQLRQKTGAERAAFLLIDVRTQAEYNLFHIDGVRHVPDAMLKPVLPDGCNPETPVIVICMTGHRSPVVAWSLKKQGVRQVYNLTWGMLGWKLWGGATRSSRK